MKTMIPGRPAGVKRTAGPGLLGPELQRLRIRNGMTKAALGRACQLNEVTILYTETGKTVLVDEHIRRVAAVLGADPAPLLEMAAIDRGVIDIRDKHPAVQRLAFRVVHGGNVSPETARKLAEMLGEDPEPLAA